MADDPRDGGARVDAHLQQPLRVRARDRVRASARARARARAGARIKITGLGLGLQGCRVIGLGLG